jgi:ankyrin repeat protein
VAAAKLLLDSASKPCVASGQGPPAELWWIPPIAYVNDKDYFKKTPIDYAKANQCLAVVELLKQHGGYEPLESLLSKNLGGW